MVGKRPPPLTPADSNYLGMGHDGLHALRWPSQSRSGLTHTTSGTVREARNCTCEAFQWSLVGDGPVGCKHTRCWSDALRHHLDPPPADPGGAVGEPPEPPELAELTECEDSALDMLRDHLRKRLDRAVAEDGDRWIQSRTSAGVRLTCASCGAVRGWASEGMAAAWLEGGGGCGCGGGGPAPPAQGAARRPIADCLHDLYGD